MAGTKGVNSAQPTTAEIVGGVYNATPPVLVDGQASALQLDINGQVKTTGGGGGGGGNVNITGVNSNPPALTNPLPVELSDGTQAVGTAGNPLSVNVITGGGSNASVGVIAATAPTSATQVGYINDSGNLAAAGTGYQQQLPVRDAATAPVGLPANDPNYAVEIGFVDNLGNLFAVSNSKPLPTTVYGGVSAIITNNPQVYSRTQDGIGTPITSTGGALDVNLLSSAIASSNMVGTVPGTAPADTSIVGQKYNVTPPAPTDGQTLPLQSDASGNLKVNVISGGGTNASIGTDGAVAPTSVTQVGGQDSNGKLQAVATDVNGNVMVGFQGQLLTVFQEILAEVRATRKLLMMVYEESGEGNPVALMDDPYESTVSDY